MSILLVAGLGNPGREYAATRHNLGFMLLNALARRHALAWSHQPAHRAETARWDNAPGGRAVLLAKPLTYMNDSGAALQSLARFHKLAPAQIVVAHDDMAFAPGLVKVAEGGSAGGHNGVASILQHLGAGFIRYRLGIGARHPPEMDIKDYVLGKFTPAEQSAIDAALPRLVDGLTLLIGQGPARAMNLLNRKPTPEKPAPTSPQPSPPPPT
jgi:PTH1 family peptidyl-tRNA hydrolase